MKIERRFIPMDLAELRLDDGADKKKIVGHPAVFNKFSAPMWGFKEKIAPGAFARAIKEDDVRALWNHNSDIVLGRNKAGTLELSEDTKGLRMEVDPPDWASDYMETIKRGDVSQMSFGFRTVKDEWQHFDDGKPSIRTLLEVELFDVSPVTYPAYPQTDVSARSLFGMDAEETGLNLEALTGLIFRMQHGQPLTASDRAMVEASIDRLRGMIPGDGQGAEPPESNGNEPQGRLHVLRRELELAEMESVG